MFDNNILILSVVLILLFIFVFNKAKETLDNSAGKQVALTSDNAFTNLHCLKTKSGDEQVLRSYTLDKNNSTLGCLINPDTKKCYNKSELVYNLVDSGKDCLEYKMVGGKKTNCTKLDSFNVSSTQVNCHPSEFLTKLIKQNNDFGHYTTRDEFVNKLNKYDVETCTTTGLNNTNHWCNKSYNNIISNPDCVKSDGKPVQFPAAYCQYYDIPTLKKFASLSVSGEQDTNIRNVLPKGKPCKQQCRSELLLDATSITDKNPRGNAFFTKPYFTRKTGVNHSKEYCDRACPTEDSIWVPQPYDLNDSTPKLIAKL